MSRVPRQHFPEDDPRREDVGAPVDRVADELLRRHVRRLAFERPGLRLRLARFGLRDPEVDELDLPVVRQKHVLRAHVAVDDLQRRAVVVRELVRIVEARQDLRQDAREHRRMDGPLALDHLVREAAERLSLEVLHDEEEGAVLFGHLERLDDVRVIETRGEARLVEEQVAVSDVLGGGRRACV